MTYNPVVNSDLYHPYIRLILMLFLMPESSFLTILIERHGLIVTVKCSYMAIKKVDDIRLYSPKGYVEMYFCTPKLHQWRYWNPCNRGNTYLADYSYFHTQKVNIILSDPAIKSRTSHCAVSVTVTMQKE